MSRSLSLANSFPAACIDLLMQVDNLRKGDVLFSREYSKPRVTTTMLQYGQLAERLFGVSATLIHDTLWCRRHLHQPMPPQHSQHGRLLQLINVV